MSEQDFMTCFGMEHVEDKAVNKKLEKSRRKSASGIEAQQWKNLYDYEKAESFGNVRGEAKEGQKKRCKSAPTRLLTQIVEESKSGSSSSEKNPALTRNLLIKVIPLTYFNN